MKIALRKRKLLQELFNSLNDMELKELAMFSFNKRWSRESNKKIICEINTRKREVKHEN